MPGSNSSHVNHEKAQWHVFIRWTWVLISGFGSHANKGCNSIQWSATIWKNLCLNNEGHKNDLHNQVGVPFSSFWQSAKNSLLLFFLFFFVELCYTWFPVTYISIAILFSFSFLPLAKNCLLFFFFFWVYFTGWIILYMILGLQELL